MTSKEQPSGDPILSVEELRKSFGGLQAVDGATFTVSEGTITGLIGPNGAGKTTMFNLLTGVLGPDSGTVRFRDETIEGRPPEAIVTEGIGRTFQTPRIFMGMTVRENLAFAAQGQSGESAFNAVFRGGRVSQEEAQLRKEVDEALSFLDLEDLAEEYARGLSGGQRKLLELGRVLMLDPDLILLDEPVAGVNPVLAEDLLDRLHALNKEGRTLLLIEHDMEIIMNNCDQIVVLHNGQVLATGPPEEIRDNEAVLEAYLGGEIA
jgi:branched-chain amino acid transport system ATP-binding protein